jgi:hypothetical protein
MKNPVQKHAVKVDKQLLNAAELTDIALVIVSENLMAWVMSIAVNFYDHLSVLTDNFLFERK